MPFQLASQQATGAAFALYPSASAGLAMKTAAPPKASAINFFVISVSLSSRFFRTRYSLRLSTVCAQTPHTKESPLTNNFSKLMIVRTDSAILSMTRPASAYDCPLRMGNAHHRVGSGGFGKYSRGSATLPAELTSLQVQLLNIYIQGVVSKKPIVA